MKTVIQDLIAKFTEAQRLIIANDEYAKGYNGALSDCISVAESFLEKEKEQIMDAAEWKGELYPEDYYNCIFGDNP